MPTLKPPPFRERPGLASLPGEVAAGVGGGLWCQPGPELLLASLLVDCNLATGTGVHDLVSHCCSGRGAPVRNALEASPHVASSRAGADAVFKFSQGRRRFRKKADPTEEPGTWQVLCRPRFLSMGTITRRRTVDTYQLHGINLAHQQKLLGSLSPSPHALSLGNGLDKEKQDGGC